MRLKLRKARDEHDEMLDQIYAAMETGNAGRARTLLKEYAAVAPEKAKEAHTDVVRDYGVSL